MRIFKLALAGAFFATSAFAQVTSPGNTFNTGPTVVPTTSVQNSALKYTPQANYAANWNNGISAGIWNLITIGGAGAQQGTSHFLGILEEVIEQTSVNQLLTYGRQITLRFTTNAKTTTQAIVAAAKLDNAIAANAISQAIHFQALIQSNLGTIGQDIGFHYPDFSALSNITTKWAFLNQDPNANIQSAAPVIGSFGAELAPANNGGYATGRYYYAGLASKTVTSTLAYTANNAYGASILISERTAFTKIGAYVSSAAAAGKLGRLAIWKVQNGVPTTKITETGTFAVDSTGDKEQTISSFTLEAGPYVIFMQTDGAPTMLMFTDFVGQQHQFWGATTAYAISGNVGGLPRLIGVGVTSVGSNPGSFDILDGVEVFPAVWLRK